MSCALGTACCGAAAARAAAEAGDAQDDDKALNDSTDERRRPDGPRVAEAKELKTDDEQAADALYRIVDV